MALGAGPAQDPRDQGLTPEIRQLAQCGASAEVVWFAGVAAGAMQRAVAGDFERQKRPVPTQDPRPGRDDLNQLHSENPRAATIQVKKNGTANRRPTVPTPIDRMLASS